MSDILKCMLGAFKYCKSDVWNVSSVPLDRFYDYFHLKCLYCFSSCHSVTDHQVTLVLLCDWMIINELFRTCFCLYNYCSIKVNMKS